VTGRVLGLSGVGLTRTGRAIVRQVSFTIEAGEVVALMGASGAGKSSVLRAIAALDPLDAGTIDVAGHVLTPGPVPSGRSLRDLHRQVGMVFQFHHLFAHKTSLENVALAPVHVGGQSRAAAERRSRELLGELGVAHRATALPHELSGGEAQRVAIARALAMEPSLLLLDEPTASLDQGRRGELAALLRRLVEQGRTLLVATHDVEFAAALASRRIVLDGGSVVQDTRAAEVS
jgi:polar amino acid transport system ATP-binding protein